MPFWKSWSLKKKVTVCLAATGVAVLLFLTARPAYEAFKTLRARWVVSDLEFDSYSRDELVKLRTALKLAPGDIKVLRKACDIYSGLNFVLAHAYWQRLMEHPGVTMEDRDAYLDFLLENRRWSLFRVQAERLADNVESPGVKKILAKYYMAAGNWSVARLLMQEVRAASPDDMESAYLLALCYLKRDLPADRTEAAALLSQVVIRGGRYLDEAVRTLVSNSLLDAHKRNRLAEYLMEEQPSLHRRLLAYDLRSAGESRERNHLIRALQDDFSDAEATSKAEVARWMNRGRDYPAVTSFISGDEAMGNRDLFLIRVDALAGMGQWEELGELLSRTGLPLTREIAALFRFRILIELDRDREAEFQWKRTLDLAKDNPAMLWYFAGYTGKLGLGEYEAGVYRQLAKLPAHRRTAFLALVRLYDDNGQSEELLGVLDTMRKEYPNDVEVANDWSYLSLLLDRNYLEARRVSSLLKEKFPRVFAFRVTYSLALLKGKEPEAALGVFQEIPLPVLENWLPEWKAVYAAVLRANDLSDQLGEVMDAIQLSALRPEEQKLIR